MLTLTDNAVTAIRALTSQPEQSPETGLRIMGQGQGVPPFQLTLADKALDAEVDDQGGVAFSVSPHPVS